MGQEGDWRAALHDAPPERILTPPTAFVSPFEIARPQDNEPVGLNADVMEYDDASKMVTATGNVVLKQEGRTLKADKITYNLDTDTVNARGRVVLMDATGDVHFADGVELHDKMKEGVVNSMKSYLANGGRFIASEGKRVGTDIIMTNASYTPCECDEDENGDSGWQIKAKEVTYHEAENRISYKDAQFEVGGVPVLWTPFLSHSDGTVNQKSGFLPPRFGYDSQLGGVLTSNYYWAIAPDKDATIGSMITTKEAPVLLGEYRQRFEKASVQLSGSATNSDRIDSVAGKDVLVENDTRGHFFAEGRIDITEKWRAGTNLELTSDEQYLRQYNISSKDVLENEVYAERFSGRNYAVGRVLAFQDVRIREEQTDQPNVLPEVIVSFVGEPNAALGGRWTLDMSTLGLQRDGNGQDVNRFVTQGGWERRFITDAGLVTTVDLGLRGSTYYVSDLAGAVPGQDDTGRENQTFAFGQMTTSYPLVKPMQKMQMVVEPVASVTVSPNVDVLNNDIPNEDSQNVQIDASNIWNPSRFPGYDRVEDGSHLTYGMRSGLYGYQGNYLDVFLGQSYRLDNDLNPFPAGSGLSEDESDIVGQVAGLFNKQYGMNYRFQLGNDDLSSRRHELEGFANWGWFHYSARYLFAKTLDGTLMDESREQLTNNVAFDLTDKWRWRTGVLHDLGEDPGLRKAVAGFDYLGCCINFSVTAERNLTTESSGDSGTSVWFRLGLRGLGDFATSGGNDDEDDYDNVGQYVGEDE